MIKLLENKKDYGYVVSIVRKWDTSQLGQYSVDDHAKYISEAM
jgi:hypothetical protein